MSEKSAKSIPLKEGFFLFLFLVTVFGAAYFFSRPPELSSHPLIGKKAPPLEFSLPGQPSSSLDKLKVRATLVNFWAIWCQPCLKEMPTLAALEKHFSSQGLMVLAFDLGQGTERLKKRLGEEGYPKHLVSDYSREQLAPYRVHTLPLTVLIDHNGVVQQVFQGPRDWMSLDTLKVVKSLLEQ